MNKLSLPWFSAGSVCGHHGGWAIEDFDDHQEWRFHATNMGVYHDIPHDLDELPSGKHTKKRTGKWP